MQRHILGIALFSSIVASAIFISWLFYIPAPPAVVPLPTEEIVFIKSKTSCWKDAPRVKISMASSVKVGQAVFNVQTKQIESVLIFENEAPAGEWTSVNLHFFKKGADGTRYLAGENLSVVSDLKTDGEAAHSVISSFVWLDSLAAYDNLYVIAERGRGFGGNVEPIAFDEKTARPVLLTGKK